MIILAVQYGAKHNMLFHWKGTDTDMRLLLELQEYVYKFRRKVHGNIMCDIEKSLKCCNVTRKYRIIKK